MIKSMMPRTLPNIRQGLDLAALLVVAVAATWGSILFYKHQSWKQFSPVVPAMSTEVAYCEAINSKKPSFD